MIGTDLVKVIETIGKDRGIKREILISALEQAMLTAAQKRYGVHATLEAHFNEESGEIDLYLFKRVVDSDDSMLEENEEIKLEEARKLDPDCQIDDEIGIKIDASFSRIDAQVAKQVIFQKVRDAEKDIVFNEFSPMKGEIISGIARRIERGSLIIDLGKTDALLPRSEIIPGEVFKPGERVQAYLHDVVMTTRGTKLYLSRTSPRFLMKLFEVEVPEMRDGVIEIKACAREPGARAKIAVTSKDRDVDPVGACVGMKGVRVQAVIQELRGEKIDIIPWSENSLIFVRSALAPAEISSVHLDEKNRAMEIIVDDSQLSLAIGRKGQNVRLAAQLTGWRLEIVSKTKLQKRVSDSTFQLQHIEGVSDTLAQAIYQAGYSSIRQISDANLEALQKIPGYEDAEAASRLKERAAAVVAKMGDALFAAPVETSTVVPTDAKSLAEERLREMMKGAVQTEAKSEEKSEEKAEATKSDDDQEGEKSNG